jgi:hypothetical protein
VIASTSTITPLASDPIGAIAVDGVGRTLSVSPGATVTRTRGHGSNGAPLLELASPLLPGSPVVSAAVVAHPVVVSDGAPVVVGSAPVDPAAPLDPPAGPVEPHVVDPPADAPSASTGA